LKGYKNYKTCFLQNKVISSIDPQENREQLKKERDHFWPKLICFRRLKERDID
jgi:hypothetical protein